MPNRVIKDSLWTSDKLMHCSIEAQLHYPRLYLLIDDYSCFEIDSPVIKGLVYPKINIQCEKIEAFLNEYAENGLLFVWEKDSKKHGYFTGIETGRLPAPTRRHKRKTPPPPIKELRRYLSRFKSLEKSPTRAYDLDTKCIQSDFPNPNPNPNPNPVVTKRHDATRRTLSGCDICATLFLIQGIESNDGKAKPPVIFSPLFDKWVDQVRLAREADGRNRDEIIDAIRFSQTDPDGFWKSNILSTSKLRKQIPRLLLQMKRNPRGYQSTETYVGRSDKHRVPISDALWNHTVEVLHSEAVKMGEDPQDHRMEFYQKMSFVFEDKANVNDWHNITKKDPLSLAAFIAERYVRINGGINETH